GQRAGAGRSRHRSRPVRGPELGAAMAVAPPARTVRPGCPVWAGTDSASRADTGAPPGGWNRGHPRNRPVRAAAASGRGERGMVRPEGALLGRSAEQREIRRVLELARGGAGGALVLTGEAGVGKSTLLHQAGAEAADLQVLSAAGIEAESALPFAGLHALLSPLLPGLDDIPAPQAAALSTAFALSAPDDVDAFAVAAGSLSLLASAAARRPVLALVDDLHPLRAPGR